MLELVNDQQEEFSKAVCGYGEYKFTDEYRFLEISQDKWLQMTPEQRKSKIDRAKKCSLKKEFEFNYVNSAATTTSDDTAAKLSVPASDANISHLQPQRVQKLWQRAEEILKCPNLVLPAAGNVHAYQVADCSTASSSKEILLPHFVYSKKSGSSTEVRCNCSIYRSTPNVCEHSLAAAEKMGILRDYVNWIQKTKASGVNIANLISKDIPASSGKKTSTSRRKGLPKGKKKTVLFEKNGLDDQLCEPSSASEFISNSTCAPTSPSTSYAMYSSPQSQYPYSSRPPFYPPTTLPPPGVISLYGAFGIPPMNTSFSPNYSNYWRHNGTSISAAPPNVADGDESETVWFQLKHLGGTRIRTCYGCGNAIRKDVSKLPAPPHDIVISYKERRYYKDPTTKETRLTSSDENTYYHLMLKCVQMKHPFFQGNSLWIDESIYAFIGRVHQTHIQEQFGIAI